MSFVDQLVHLRDVPGGPRFVRGRQHPEPVVLVAQDALVGVRQRPERDARLGRLGQHLVVDVGDVADERDPVAGVRAATGAARRS